MKLQTRETTLKKTIAPKLSEISKMEKNDTNEKLTITEKIFYWRKIPLTTLEPNTSAPIENDNRLLLFLKLGHDHSDILNNSYINF